MIEIKAELLTGMKRSCQKVYFTMKHNPKSEICYKVGEIDRREILMGSFNNVWWLINVNQTLYHTSIEYTFIYNTIKTFTKK